MDEAALSLAFWMARKEGAWTRLKAACKKIAGDTVGYATITTTIY